MTLGAQLREPLWVVLERAGRLELEGDLGRAMQLYLRVLEQDRDNAEATLGLARLFRDSGDPDVAATYFDDALARRDNFEVSANRVVVRYERASFFHDRLEYAAYERELQAIVAEDETEVDLPDSLLRVLTENGLDDTLVLYRGTENSATAARGLLTSLLVQLGRYDEAAEYGLRAIVEQVTTIVDAILERDPFFQFSTLDEALQAARQYPETRGYLKNARLFEDLYYTAAALYGEQRSPYRTIWQLVAGQPEAGSWAGRAARQLADPQTEPLLVEPDE
jgi:hypothetical protein